MSNCLQSRPRLARSLDVCLATGGSSIWTPASARQRNSEGMQRAATYVGDAAPPAITAGGVRRACLCHVSLRQMHGVMSSGVDAWTTRVS